MSAGNLYPQTVWDSGYRGLQYDRVGNDDQVARWLKEAVQQSKPGSCIEIGCYPGRYLALFGDLGYELNGIDLTPRTAPEMADWLRSLNYPIGQIAQEDFFRFKNPKRYDVVYSNGFIEHFEDWGSALDRHAEMVADGGLLLVNVPNFKGGLQRFLHRLLDRENLDRHCLSAMDPVLWAQRLRSQGFEILKQGYFAGFDFWIGEQKRNFAQKLLFFGLRAMIPLLRNVLPKDSAFCAPYCGLVARRLSKSA